MTGKLIGVLKLLHDHGNIVFISITHRAPFHAEPPPYEPPF